MVMATSNATMAKKSLILNFGPVLSRASSSSPVKNIVPVIDDDLVVHPLLIELLAGFTQHDQCLDLELTFPMAISK